MKNREAVLRKIDQLSSSLNSLNSYLNQGNRESYIETLEKIYEQLDQLRTYVEIEPIAGNELNPN